MYSVYDTSYSIKYVQPPNKSKQYLTTPSSDLQSIFKKKKKKIDESKTRNNLNTRTQYCSGFI